MSAARLRRYWFPAEPGYGIGVTAWSEDDARALLALALPYLNKGARIGAPVADIAIDDLDTGHVRPNMGVCAVRGVWFPDLPWTMSGDAER